MKARPKSLEIFENLKEVIPGGCNSPARAFTNMGMFPLIAEKGSEDLVTDADGFEYIDFNLAWGSLILGHVNPFVVEETKNQISQGSSFGLSTNVEYLLAKKVCDMVSTVEKIRFVSSGTEATMTAVRIARGFTKKNIILKFNGHYHGHSDAFLVKAGSGLAHHFEDASSKGVPKEMVSQTVSIPFNDEQAFLKFYETYHHDLAGIILEPVAGNMGCVLAEESFLKLLREKTQECGALLIFDEVITGFRVAKGGAEEFYNISPDLKCFGKIIGAGYPVAAVGGKKHIMETLAPLGGVYQAGTLSGNPAAMRAGLSVLKQIDQQNFYENLIDKTEKFLKPIEEEISGLSFPVCLNKAGSMFTLFLGLEKVERFEDLVDLDRELFNQFFQHLFEKGIYISPSPYETCFLSSAHTDEHLEYVQKVIIEYLQVLDQQMKSGSLKNEYATSKE